MLVTKMTFAALNLGLIDVKRRIVVKRTYHFEKGAIECTFEYCSCKTNLKILKRKLCNICVTFEGKIKYSSLEIKRRKTIGKNREHYRVVLKDNEGSPKLYRLSLLKLSGDQFASGKQTGPSRSALNNIKAQSSSHESAEELMVAITRLRLDICNEDEAVAIKIIQRRSFRYDK